MAWYKNSLKTCRNMLVNPFGGVRNRSGSEFIAYTPTAATPGVLIPFSFSNDQNYILELCNLTLRVVRLGSVLPITTLVTTYLYTELHDINYTQSADVLTIVHPNHPPMQLRRYSDATWTFVEQPLLQGPFQSVNTDTSYAVFPSSAVGAITIKSTKAMFYAKHVGMLFYLEQKDFGESWLPGKLKAIGNIVRSGGNYYQALTAGTTGQNIPIGTGTHWNDGGVDWAYLHNGYGVARILEITSSTEVKAEVQAGARMPDGSVTTGFATGITVTACAASALPGYIDGTATAHGLTVGSYGTCKIDITGGLVASDVCDYQVKDANTVSFFYPFYYSYGVLESISWSYNTVTKFYPPVGTNSASYKWAFGAFGDPTRGDGTNGYGHGFPGAVTYYQQRLVFAGTATNPDTVWMSKTSNYDDFGQSLPSLDDDAVVFTLSSNQVNQIKGLLQLDKLLLLTSGSVWATGSGAQVDVITPGNIGVKLQGYTGVSNLQPIGIGGAAMFVQSKNQIVRDMNYQWVNDSYTGQNLTAKGSHLVDGYYITDWTDQRSPLCTVWMVRDDGMLLGLTYLREQEVVAWHRHDTDGEFVSVCSITEGQEDVLYAMVKRTLGGTTRHTIERFRTRIVTDITDAFFVDCGLTITNSPASATVSGLTHLNGKTVNILADGLVHPPLLVASGAVTLQYAASKIQVGLPIISDIETLPLAPPQGESTRSNYKLITTLRMVVNEARSVWAGPDVDHLYEAKTRTVSTGFNTPPNLVTGIVEIHLASTWERNGTTMIRHTEPTPIGILALLPEVTVGGA